MPLFVFWLSLILLTVFHNYYVLLHITPVPSVVFGCLLSYAFPTLLIFSLHYYPFCSCALQVRVSNYYMQHCKSARIRNYSPLSCSYYFVLVISCNWHYRYLFAGFCFTSTQPFLVPLVLCFPCCQIFVVNTLIVLCLFSFPVINCVWVD